MRAYPGHGSGNPVQAGPRRADLGDTRTDRRAEQPGQDLVDHERSQEHRILGPAHYTINERGDGLVAMSIDGHVKCKTDQQLPFVRGGMILADGLLLMTDGNTKLYLVEPSPAGFKPLASAVILEPGDNWAPLALVDGTLLVRGQKELKALQVAP